MTEHVFMVLIGAIVASFQGWLVYQMSKQLEKIGEQTTRQTALIKTIIEHLAVLRGQR